MKKPIVTALLPVWTGEDYIEETINSILKQTLDDWDMLVIGEPDGPHTLKQTTLRYAAMDSRIRWIENETHLGLAATLNKGIELASGKYIARVDVDDPSYPQRFEKQVRYLEEHPNVGILGSQSRDIHPDYIKVTDLPVQPENIRASLLFGKYICHPALMLRRELFIVNGWRYSEDWLQEDHALWHSLLDKVEFANLDEPLIDHRAGILTRISFLKRKEIPDNHHKLIAKTIRDHLHIKTHNYPINRFLNTYERPSDFVKISDLAAWISDNTSLQLEMERANRVYSIFDVAAFARTLRLRWNWMMDGCLISSNQEAMQKFPRLHEKSPGSFRGDLVQALADNGFSVCETSEDEEIVSVIKGLAEAYEGRLLRVLTIQPRVVIFGTGFYCDRFFEDYKDASRFFDIIAFCDNDKSKHGQVKTGKPVISPDSLSHISYDNILIATKDYYDDVHAQLTSEGIASEMLLPLDVFRFYGE